MSLISWMWTSFITSSLAWPWDQIQEDNCPWSFHRWCMWSRCPSPRPVLLLFHTLHTTNKQKKIIQAYFGGTLNIQKPDTWCILFGGGDNVVSHLWCSDHCPLSAWIEAMDTNREQWKSQLHICIPTKIRGGGGGGTSQLFIMSVWHIHGARQD